MENEILQVTQDGLDQKFHGSGDPNAIFHIKYNVFDEKNIEFLTLEQLGPLLKGLEIEEASELEGKCIDDRLSGLILDGIATSKSSVITIKNMYIYKLPGADYIATVGNQLGTDENVDLLTKDYEMLKKHFGAENTAEMKNLRFTSFIVDPTLALSGFLDYLSGTNLVSSPY